MNNSNTDINIAAKDSKGGPLAYFFPSSFDEASRTFLFTITNRTNLTFTMHKTNIQYGIIETPYPQLGPGNTDKGSELRIRGYKSANIFWGVSCTLHFRIQNCEGKNTEQILNIFLEIGVATTNCFGWCIGSEEDILTARKWYADSKPCKEPKTNCDERHIIKGNTATMRAIFSTGEHKFDIEMFTDNSTNSLPSMIIKSVPNLRD